MRTAQLLKEGRSVHQQRQTLQAGLITGRVSKVTKYCEMKAVCRITDFYMSEFGIFIF